MYPGIRLQLLAEQAEGVERERGRVKGVDVVRNADFARHSVMYGWRRIDVVLRHILPNVLRTIPVLATLDMGLSIMASSGLSFLGLGPKAPIP
ncbi:ABC transporter permease subunit [Saccharopolyspora sp. ASAGF58]|uniref:ABC transporter permease subunit n=1 Tax=Saccharopolyspora sp. ASAGF58 TaxID=2719023 RepID=UPI001B3183FF|nr:ABC transporter permease subunit [Saccharopolyspora sp. ASAGF58]